MAGGGEGSEAAITLRPVSETREIEQLDELAGEVRITRLAPPPGSLPAPRPASRLPVRAASALAAGGFLAGAAAVGIVSRRQRRPRALTRAAGRLRLPGARPRARRRSRRAPAGADALQVVATRKLLIDVHLLAGPGADG